MIAKPEVISKLIWSADLPTNIVHRQHEDKKPRERSLDTKRSPVV